MNGLRWHHGLFGLLLCSFGTAWASTAVIDAVQMPAWLQHDGRKLPLAPGQQVRDGDRVLTGQDARAYIRLPEGSTVKLGAGALLTYQSAPAEKSLFKAALDVATGAFRFTTAAIRKLQKRDVAIHVGTATIGIRGTDVWGRSGKDEDLVMLIEGHVEVKPAQGEALELKEPMAVFTAAKGGAAAPLTLATAEQFQARARETEIMSGDGAARPRGKSSLRLGSFTDEGSALALYDKLRTAGYNARIRPSAADAGEGWNYEVALYGLAGKGEVAAVAARLKAAGIEAAAAR